MCVDGRRLCIDDAIFFIMSVSVAPNATFELLLLHASTHLRAPILSIFLSSIHSSNTSPWFTYAQCLINSLHWKTNQNIDSLVWIALWNYLRFLTEKRENAECDAHDVTQFVSIKLYSSIFDDFFWILNYLIFKYMFDNIKIQKRFKIIPFINGEKLY